MKHHSVGQLQKTRRYKLQTLWQLNSEVMVTWSQWSSGLRIEDLTIYETWVFTWGYSPFFRKQEKARCRGAPYTIVKQNDALPCEKKTFRNDMESSSESLCKAIPNEKHSDWVWPWRWFQKIGKQENVQMNCTKHMESLLGFFPHFAIKKHRVKICLDDLCQ